MTTNTGTTDRRCHHSLGSAAETCNRHAPARALGWHARPTCGCSLYFLLPLWLLIVAGTKSTQRLFSGSGGPLWFDKNFALFDNLRQLATYKNGIHLRWLGNSFLYTTAGGVGATVLAVLAGYAFAKYRFRGRTVSFMILLASMMVPAAALVIPTCMLFNNLGVTNTICAVILPSLLSPFVSTCRMPSRTSCWTRREWTVPEQSGRSSPSPYR